MKVKLFVMLLALAALTVSASAQQDPNDPGNPDSVNIRFTLTPDVANGDSTVAFSVQFVVDQATLQVSGGYQWDFEPLLLDSCIWTTEATTIFSFGRIFWANNNRDSTNFYNRFQVTGFTFSGFNAPLDVCTFYGHVSSWAEGDTIRISPHPFVARAFTLPSNDEYVPIWGGNAVVADVTAIGGGSLPMRFDLAQNYPNPFNPFTKVKFDLPKRAHATLTVYNVLGQKVATLVDEELPADSYEVEWNGRSDGGDPVASGVYFYRLTADDFVMTKKMMMLK
jgi:hypothetical protein